MGYAIAHRGLSERHRENSLAAIAAAVQHVPVVEVDVRCTRDGVPVCLHDATLVRTEGVPYRVSHISHRRLRELAPEVPTLAEALETVAAAGGAAMLDVKSTRAIVLPAVMAVVEASAMRWSDGSDVAAGEPLAPGTLSFQSRESSMLEAVRAHGAIARLLHVRSEAAVQRAVAWARQLRHTAHGLTLPDRFATPELLRALGQAQLPAYVYTVNDPARYQELVAAGASGVYTDVADTITAATLAVA